VAFLASAFGKLFVILSKLLLRGEEPALRERERPEWDLGEPRDAALSLRRNRSRAWLASVSNRHMLSFA
jgi:hypothetical protein